jgi:phosphoribosylformylglycinamidine (FGAM) synthase-like enzyme
VLKEEEICINKLHEMKVKKYHGFSEPLDHILKAITERKEIDGINISEAVRDHNFRFYTKDQPLLSLEISNVVAQVSKDLKRKVPPQFLQSGREKKSEHANEFASRMHETINQLKLAEKISTYRETAKFLNEKKFPTYAGGKWHVSTLQELNKRWKKLGLSPFTTNPK